MRVPLFSRAALFGLSLIFTQHSPAEDKPYVAPYLDDKAAALSFTFDDGFKKEVKDTVEIIDSLGIRGTFFVIPLRMEDPKMSRNCLSWERAKELQAAGHEIGTHDAVKFKLQDMTAEQLDQRINGSWRLILEKTGLPSVSYARPGGSVFTPEAVAKIREHHYFLRENKQLPRAVTISYGSAGNRRWEDQKARARIEEALAKGGWVIPIVHSIVGGYSPFQSKDEFRQHCEYLKSIDDRLWIAPLGTVGRYVFERDAAELEIKEKGSQSLAFTLNHTLPNKAIFNHPLTIVVPAKKTRYANATTAAGDVLTTTVSNGKIRVNCPPDGSKVTVTWE